MDIAINVPEEVGRSLKKRWNDLPWRTLEAVAAQAYRDGVLTAAEVGRMLGFSSRWKTEAFLKQAGCYLDYTVEDLQRDAETTRQMTGGTKS